MFIAAHEFISVPLRQHLHSYSPSLLSLTTGILEDLYKTRSPDVLYPYFESMVTFRHGGGGTVVTTGTGHCAGCSKQLAMGQVQSGEHND